MRIFSSPLSETLNQMSAEPPAKLYGTEAAKLKNSVNNLLNTRLSDLKLPDDVQAIFKARTSRVNRKMMESWCLWVGMLNVVLTGFDIFSVSDGVLWYVLLCRMLITASFLAANFALRRQLLHGSEHLAIIVACMVAIIGAGTAGRLTGDNAIASDYNINALLVVFSGITFVNIELRHAKLLAGLSIILIGGFILAGASLHLAGKLQLITLYAGTMVAMVQARRILNLHQMRLFLVNLREEISIAETSDRNAELSSIAYIDQLTEIPNRRYFDELCASITENTKNLLPLSLCMIDVDYFKRLNDSLGHLQGDRCLRLIAGTIRHCLRAKDILVRYGGEEFLLMLPGTDIERAGEIAERVRAAIEASQLDNPDSVLGIVTASIGISVATAHPVSIETLIEAADMALYRAKSAGRNQVGV